MKKYDTIVLSGGGMKGFTMLGTLQYLYQQGVLSNIKKYIGTSIGSIVSLMMIMDYEPSDVIIHFIQNSKQLELLKQYNIVSGIRGNGFVDYKHFEQLIKDLILKKMDKIPTLLELYKKFPIELQIITFNYSQNKEQVLSHKTTPNLSVLDAVRMSSNVPFLFSHFEYENNFYFDGFITNIFPIDKIDINEDVVLGIRFYRNRWKQNSSKKIQNLKVLWNIFLLPFFKIQSISGQTFLEHCDVLNLDTEKDTFFNFNISSKIILDMFSNGYSNGKMYFINK